MSTNARKQSIVMRYIIAALIALLLAIPLNILMREISYTAYPSYEYGSGDLLHNILWKEILF